MFEQSSGSLTQDPQSVPSSMIIIPFGHSSHLTTTFSQAPQHYPLGTCMKSAGQASQMIIEQSLGSLTHLPQ
jgi:hypothetical protein